jgi:long-chain acyl-CoA synthetase
MTPAAFPDLHAAQSPQKVAQTMAGSGDTVTFAELVKRSRQVAHLLRGNGVRPGETVAILLENHARFLEITWAAQRAGLRYTAVSTRLTASEIGYILRDSGARALFTSETYLQDARRALTDAPDVGLVVSVDGPAGGFGDYLELVDSQPHTPAEAEGEGVDLLYSSGTTGRPKGVEANLSLAPLGTPPGAVALLQSLYGFDAESVYLCPAPLYHAAPLRFSMVAQRFGGTVVVMERFDPLTTLELIQRHRVTHVQMVPTMFIRMLKLSDAERDRFDLSSLRTVIHAAAPCPPSVKAQMVHWLGPVVHEYYSSTEAYLFTAIGSEEALARPGSVGRPLLGTPHILDDAGRELPPGEPGTIWSEGGLDFVYRNDPEKTAGARDRHGWTTVGDIGFIDGDGYLYLTDRKADMIIAGGVNVYPQESENVLVTHPEVADAAVFGIPHPELGEEVKGVVQPVDMELAGQELEARLLAFCHERLAKYKCPRTIDFAAELPRHPTGKLYKRLLRDRYLNSR